MIKQVYKLMAVLAVLVLGSCDHYDFDAIQPIDAVTAELAITDRQSAAAARAGVYDGLQNATLTFDGYLASFQYFSDECIFTGTFPTRQEFANYNVTTANTTMAAMFSAYYNVINRVNNILEILPRVEDITLSEGVVNNFLAEARFGRALAYFHLIQGWQEVPLITTPTRGVGAELNVPKSPVADIYAQIEQDLTFARDNLNANSIGATPAAANALLARVALYQGRYPDAGNFARAAIGEGYDLTTIPYLQDEIFFLKFSPADGNSLAFFYGTAELNGRHSIEPSAKLIAAFEEGDARFEESIGFDSGNVPYGNKYRNFNASAGAQTDPLRFLRGAEMVLILAEVAARNGEFGTASNMINMVRSRAGLADITLTAGNWADAILQERFVELAMEGGHRLWDLRRFGRAEEVLGPEGYDACDAVWPLPQRDIDRNENLVQNNCCNC